MFRSALVAVLAVALSSTSAFAQTPLAASQALLPLAAQIAGLASAQPMPVTYNVVVRGRSRPAAMKPLYASLIALQGLDLYTSFAAFDAGFAEGNPLFKSRHRPTMIATKAGAMAVNVYLAEKLWKTKPKTAVALLILNNCVMSAVVVHNYRLTR